MRSNINQLDVMKVICEDKDAVTSASEAFARYSKMVQLESKNKVNNLLLRRIPEIMSYYIKLQAVIEGQKPEHSLLQAQHRSLTKTALNPALEAFARSPHDYFSYDHDKRELLDCLNLNTACNNYNNSRTLFNGQQANISSQLIERSIQLYHNSSALSLTGRLEDKLNDIMHYIEDQHVPYPLMRYFYDNSKNKFYTKFFKNYKPLTLCRQNYIDIIETIEYRYCNLIEFRYSNDILMIMLNLYLIAERITKSELNDKYDYLETKHMGSNLAPALVIGAYEAGSLLFEGFLSSGYEVRYCKAKHLSDFSFKNVRINEFPSFIDFSVILYKLICKEVVPLVCNNCSSHYMEYLKFSDPCFTLKNLFSNAICPKCGSDLGYYLDESYAQSLLNEHKKQESTQKNKSFIFEEEKKEAP